MLELRIDRSENKCKSLLRIDRSENNCKSILLLSKEGIIVKKI